MAADDDDLLLLLNYIDTLSPADRVFRQHSNPLQEYDEMKFRQRFRLSKSTVLSLLLEVGIIHDRFDYNSQACGMHVQCQGHSPFITGHHCKVNMSAVNLTNWAPFGGCHYVR